jgi:predicted permease
MIQDLRFGIRTLRRSPGFALLAVFCLTLGIGATTAVFSWIEGILLRPYPLVASQNRMVAMAGTDRDGRTDVSWPDFEDLRRNNTLVEAFVAEHIFGTTLSVGERAQRATGSVVSANYFQALGIRPILGRFFEPSEDFGRKGHPVTVISYQAWKDRYGLDPAIIGKQQMLNGVKHTIVGVAPEGFFGTFVGYSFQFWVPASMEEVFGGGTYKLENRGARWIEGFAVLKPGVTIEQAQSEMSAVAQRLENEYPSTNRNRGIRLYPLWQTPFNGAGTLLPTLRVSLVVACFVLLIACANVGNLLLVRSLGRRHEMTVRLSLGAGRLRLIRQLLTEGLVLAVAAGAGGLLLANICRSAIALLFPYRPGVIVNLPAQIDFRVLAVSTTVCVLATILFGLVPALQASRIDLAGAMKSDSGSVAGGRGRTWMRSSLVAVQVALSFVLLVGAGILLKSLQAMRTSDPGFSTKSVITTSVDMVAAGYDPARIGNFQDQLVDRVSALGGVESVSWTRMPPFSYGGYSSSPIMVDGFEAQPGEQPVVEYAEIGPGWLRTMGIPLVSGREFMRGDTANTAGVAVVNEAMVTQYWPGQDPIGKRVQVKGRWLDVVGVAKISKYRSLIEPAKPFLYVPMSQSQLGQSLQIKSQLGPEAIAHALTREIRALDPDLAPGEVITMREQVDRMIWPERAASTLLTSFSAIALLLAGIGLYGVMSYSVSEKQEGVGAANGAGRQRVGSPAAGDGAGNPADHGRDDHWRGRGPAFHQADGRPALQREPSRSERFPFGRRSHGRRRSGGSPSAGLEGGANGSRACSAGVKRLADVSYL